jgi:hypothetical protein
MKNYFIILCFSAFSLAVSTGTRAGSSFSHNVRLSKTVFCNNQQNISHLKKKQDSTDTPRKRLTLREWIRTHTDTVSDPTYRELASKRQEHGFVTMLKTLVLIPVYAVAGAGAFIAGCGSIAILTMTCIGLYATAVTAGLLFWPVLLPYFAIALLGVFTGGLAAFGFAYISELPTFDKARPFAVGFYTVIAYIIIGIFYLFFEMMD